VKLFSLTFAVLLTLAGCSGATTDSEYSSDCARLEQRFSEMVSRLQTDILTLMTDERLVERVVLEDGETRRFKGLPPSVIDEWHEVAQKALEGSTTRVYGESWPRTSNEDLQQVLKELSREELWMANDPALRAMCPGMTARLDGALAEVHQSVEDKAKSLEIPSGIEP